MVRVGHMSCYGHLSGIHTSSETAFFSADIRPEKSPCNGVSFANPEKCWNWKSSIWAVFSADKAYSGYMDFFHALYQPWKKLSVSLCESLFKGVTHWLKSALKKALSWTILYDRNYIFFSLNCPARSFFSTYLSLCE